MTSKTSTTRVDHSVAIAQYASMRNVDTTKAGKLFRARLRSNFSTIVESDPTNYGPDGTFKVNANDKRPWGSHDIEVLRALKLAPAAK